MGNFCPIKKSSIVYVVDDDIEICRCLQWLLNSVDLNVETYQSASSFLYHYNPLQQGCLILDVRMPIISGMELLSKLKQNKYHLPVILMTGYGDIEMAVKAMKEGAVDYILKPIDEQYLLDIVNHHLTNFSSANLPALTIKQCGLTKREQQIVNMIINGRLNKEIAYELNISMATVEAHRSRIMRKYQAKNLAQLIKNYFSIPDLPNI